MNKHRSLVFISSVQKELAEERQALKSFIAGDALLRRFFEVFLFEELPASGRRADEVYLAEVDRCDVYLALLGNEYGHQDRDGVSPTEREFDRATAKGKERLVYVRGADGTARHPKMQTLIEKAGVQLTRRRFGSLPELTALVYASLVENLERSGHLRTKPFDAAVCRTPRWPISRAKKSPSSWPPPRPSGVTRSGREPRPPRRWPI